MSDRFEIALVDVRNHKRIFHVRIDPTTAADRRVYLIAGRNSNGKSSVLESFDRALRGDRGMPARPVREGADKAELAFVLEGKSGRFRVTRTITGSGKDIRTQLKVVGPNGAVTKPQEWLNEVVGERFLDVGGFITAKPAEQRRALLQVAGIDVDGLDADRKRAFEARTDENRALKAAETRQATIKPMSPAPDAARPIDQIQRELDQIEATIAVASQAAAEHRRLQDHLASLESEDQRLRQEMERVRLALEALAPRLDKGRTAVRDAAAQVPTPNAIHEQQERRAAARVEQQRSQAAAVWRAQKHERDRQIADADAEVERRRAASEVLTREIAAIDEMKSALLAGADMPVPGIAVTEDGVTLNGFPFEQAGQAEQLSAAIAIAARQSPGLRDVWVRQGAYFDPDDGEGIDRLRKVAEDLDCYVWLEVPGERGHEGAIIIRDGRVLGADGEA